MTRLFLASIAVVSALAVVPDAVEAQKPTPKKGALSRKSLRAGLVPWALDYPSGGSATM